MFQDFGDLGEPGADRKRTSRLVMAMKTRALKPMKR